MKKQKNSANFEEILEQNHFLNNNPVSVTLITTGGTIEKIYDESDGSLYNKGSIVQQTIINRLRLPYTQLEVFSILAKDSLTMTEEDRQYLAYSLKNLGLEKKNPTVILHGTDTMAQSAQYCLQEYPDPPVPVVFTGSMMPLGFEDSDARQNVTEAILASRILMPGHYISFHGRVFKVPHAQKNRSKRTFESV